MSKKDVLQAAGALLLAVVGGVVGYIYQRLETGAKLEVQYVSPRYDVSYRLPMDLVKQLAREDFVRMAEGLVAWPFAKALEFNSWQRREFEDLKVILGPLKETLSAKAADVEVIRAGLSSQPSCDSMFKLFVARRWILEGGTPIEFYSECVKNPTIIATMRSSTQASLDDFIFTQSLVLELEKTIDARMQEKSPSKGPLVIDIGITNFGETEGAVSNRPVLRLDAPEALDAALRLHIPPRPWERDKKIRELRLISPDQPIISVTGHSFIDLTVELDRTKNSPDIIQKVEDSFARGIAKGRIVFLTPEGEDSLSSRQLTFRPN